MHEKKLIGLFFGSFNPIHTGHLIICNHLLNTTNLDQIWFVVSPLNPLKDQKDLFDENTRIELVKLAIEGNPKFGICIRELSMPRPSYTFETLKVLIQEHPDCDFTLIIGSDNLEVFSKWKDHEAILELLPLIVYPRSAECNSPFLYHTSVTLVNAPLIELSSTYIRWLLANDKDIRYYVPEKVYSRIQSGIL
jgi:nicotinate-nucleotide adenylyltransferase